MKYAIAFLGLLGAALAGCNNAHGGGTMPSADLDPSHKSTFGFSYRCDDATQKVTGVFNYQDHGAGLRFTGKINEQLTQIACGQEYSEIGITGACGVVTKGSGGAAAGDLLVVATADGSAVDPETDDGVMVFLFHPGVPLDPSTPIADYDCAAVVQGQFGSPYYANSGVLSSGNVIASQ